MTYQNQTCIELAGDTPQATNGLASFDLIDSMLSEFSFRERKIEATHRALREAMSNGVMDYFVKGMNLANGYDARYSIPTDIEGAKAVLRAEYWRKALNMTDIFEAMPIKMRTELREQFNGIDCPAFDEDTVRPTLQSLLAQRRQFMAQRVDGIFNGLSGSHITNQPNGFGQKLIINNAYDKYGYVSNYKSGLIADLRSVIAQLNGRGEVNTYSSTRLLDKLYRGHTGKKVSIDGGALTLTVYKVGTVHITIHSDIAIALNSILAALYPTAIPAQFRTQKKTHAKTFEIQSNMLQTAVIDGLLNLEPRGDHYSLNLSSVNEASNKQCLEILADLGGEVAKYSTHATIKFDYYAAPVIEQVIFTGSVPDNASSQFYPTRSEIADIAAELLDVSEGMLCLEPQAGTGDLAKFLPVATTTCIEISKVRSKVLEQKGFNTITADFLSWTDANQNKRFDRILCNPPFSKGRALAHLKAAASLLKQDGKIVAILPASMKGTEPLQGFDHKWSEVMVDMFENTHVRVAILTASIA